MIYNGELSEKYLRVRSSAVQMLRNSNGEVKLKKKKCKKLPVLGAG